MFKTVTPAGTTVIRSDSRETGLLPPKPQLLDGPFQEQKGLGYSKGRLAPVSQALVGAWALGLGKGRGRLCKHMLDI